MSESAWGGNDRGPIFNGVTWTVTLLATITVALRVISRTAFGGNKLGLDDYITFVALAVIYATTITLSLAVAAGGGKHVFDLPPQDVPVAVSRIATANVICLWAFSLPKFAIVAVIARLLHLQSWTRIMFWGLAGISQAGILVLTVFFTTQCQTCGDLKAQAIVGWIVSVMSPLLDILYAIYPIPFIMKLNMSQRKRIYISCALSSGCLASAVSMYKASLIPTVAVAITQDPTYGILPIVMFGQVEACTLIIMASLPTLGPVLRWVLGKSPFTQYTTDLSATYHGNTFPKNSKGYRLRGGDEFETMHSDRRAVLGKLSVSKSGIYKSAYIAVSRE